MATAFKMSDTLVTPRFINKGALVGSGQTGKQCPKSRIGEYFPTEREVKPEIYEPKLKALLAFTPHYSNSGSLPLTKLSEPKATSITARVGGKPLRKRALPLLKPNPSALPSHV